MSVFGTQEEILEERLGNYAGYELSDSMYNLVVGATISYGIWLNVLMVHWLGPMIGTTDTITFNVLFFVSYFFGVVISRISNSAIVSFIGYNFIVIPIGLLFADVLPNLPIEIVQQAWMITGCVTLLMTVAATICPSLFEVLGFPLLIGLLGAIVTKIIFGLFGVGGAIFDWLFVIIFSLYIGFDWWRAQNCPKTANNAVDCAIDLYIDIINLFIRILTILLRNDERKNRYL